MDCLLYPKDGNCPSHLSQSVSGKTVEQRALSLESYVGCGIGPVREGNHPPCGVVDMGGSACHFQVFVLHFQPPHEDDGLYGGRCKDTSGEEGSPYFSGLPWERK